MFPPQTERSQVVQQQQSDCYSGRSFASGATLVSDGSSTEAPFNAGSKSDIIAFNN